MPHKIFISYRRQDTAANALGISQYLEHEFGRKNVFIDVDMRAGEKFPTVLEQHLAECKVMLVLIGPDWLNSCDEQGHRRLDNSDDWVRLEIAYALKRNITVIPVRVNGAELPAKKTLPDDIRSLLDHQAVSVTNVGFRHEMSGLVKDIHSIPSPKHWRRLGSLAAGIVILLAAFALIKVFALSKLFESTRFLSIWQPTKTTTTDIWNSGPADWVLYAYDKNWIGYYFKVGSVKAFGDNVAYTGRFPFKWADTGTSSAGPMAAYQDDRLVLACNKAVYAMAETTIYNKSGEIMSHFKRSEPEAMDTSAGAPIAPGSILSLAEYLMCNKQLRTPLAEQIRQTKLTYLSSTPEADLFYGPVHKLSAPPDQFEVLVVGKFFRDHSLIADLTPGHPIIGIAQSYKAQAQMPQVNCSDRSILVSKLEYYDAKDKLTYLKAVVGAKPNKVEEGTPFSLLLDTVCGAQVSKVSGTYEGMNIATYKMGGQGEQQITITIEQVGNNLNVSFHTASGGQGKGSGTFTDNKIESISLQSTAANCPGSYDASFQFSDDTVTWSFKGEDCGGPMEGHGTAKKSKV